MTSDPPLLLGLDLGTTNCKAVVFNRQGQTLAQGRAPTPTRVPQPGRAEYDPDELWTLLVGIIRAALADLRLAGYDPAAIVGVGVASMAEAGLLLDGHGQPCGPIISWYDDRTLAEGRWWAEDYGGERVFAITGLIPRHIYSICKLMWLRRHQPEAFNRATRWLHVGDWVIYRLSGGQATTPSFATRTMVYDLAHGVWSTELLTAADIPVSLLPPIVPSGQVLGWVTAEAATATGLVQGTPVVTGGHDHIVGAFGAGATGPGQVLNSMGTAEALVLSLGGQTPAQIKALLNDTAFRARSHFGAHVAPDAFYTIASAGHQGATLDWARRLLVPDLDPVAGFARLNELAQTAPPGSRGALLLAHVTGAGRPISDPQARGALIGLTPQTERPEVARAVFEGMAYAWRTALDSLTTTADVAIERVTIIGGGARNPVWLQAKADVAQRALTVLEVEEAVAWGAAALAGAGIGLYRDAADMRSQVRFGERQALPNPDHAALYERVYHEVYGELYQTLKESHARLAKPS